MKLLKTSFAGGEISPSMQNRFDFQGYNNSALWIENFQLTKEGNLNFRNGTYLIDKAFDNRNDDKALNNKTLVRLFDWKYSDSRIFLLAFVYDTEETSKILIYENFTKIRELNADISYKYFDRIQTDYLGNTFYIRPVSKIIY